MMNLKLKFCVLMCFLLHLFGNQIASVSLGGPRAGGGGLRRLQRPAGLVPLLRGRLQRPPARCRTTAGGRGYTILAIWNILAIFLNPNPPSCQKPKRE